MIDLNNAWCESTEEIYNALVRLGYKDSVLKLCSVEANTYLEWDVLILSNNRITNYIKKEELTDEIQIHLINGEFQYVETKPKNNFKDYGFEADFEGIIYEKYITPCNQTFFNGAIWFRPKDDYHYMKPVSWTDKGSTIHYHVQEHYLTSYNLIPIKKEWYENPDNFPCIVLDRNYNMFLAKGIDIDNFLTQEFNKQIGHIKHFRPATKEEVLALLVKE